jgi:rubredoxin
MKKYKCKLCGVIYDPCVGDPIKDIRPDTSFEELPENWCCPSCGAKKKMFKEL